MCAGGNASPWLLRAPEGHGCGNPGAGTDAGDTSVHQCAAAHAGGQKLEFDRCAKGGRAYQALDALVK